MCSPRIGDKTLPLARSERNLRTFWLRFICSTLVRHLTAVPCINTGLGKTFLKCLHRLCASESGAFYLSIVIQTYSNNTSDSETMINPTSDGEDLDNRSVNPGDDARESDRNTFISAHARAGLSTYLSLKSLLKFGRPAMHRTQIPLATERGGGRTLPSCLIWRLAWRCLAEIGFGEKLDGTATPMCLQKCRPTSVLVKT